MTTPRMRAPGAGLHAPKAAPRPLAAVPDASQLAAFRALLLPHVTAQDLLVVILSRAAGQVWCEWRHPNGRTCRVSYTVAHVVLLGEGWAADAAITLLAQHAEV